MHSQAQEFFNLIQERLLDPNFQGIMFQDGAVLSPTQLRQISDPEILLRLVARISDLHVPDPGLN